jgi:hypothetical protein
MVSSPTTMALSPASAGSSQTSTKISDWHVPFIQYLTDGTGYSDRTKNERLIRRSKQYLVVEGKLRRKNAKAEVLMKCIEQEDGIKIMAKIHSGTYGNHAASRTLVGKVFRAGFYWPSAVADAEKLVRHCANCQFFSKRVHVPAHDIQTIPASWPFACWGLDMIGPFKPAPGNFKFVFVLIDKFSNWIEYKPLVKASSKKAVEFLDQVIHRFGIPNNIITDLGTQFTGNMFWDFYDEWSIVVKYVSVAHPRANGQVERANGMILDALKKRMYRQNDKAPGRWIKELPAVVWGLRTQPSRNTGVSPYFMVYGAEAVLLADIEFRSPRVENYNEDQVTEQHELEVNSADERRLNSCIRMAKYLAVLRRYYNKMFMNISLWSVTWY